MVPASLAASTRAAIPSPATLALIPTAASYELVLGRRGELGVVVSRVDGRIWARLYLDEDDDDQLHLDFEGPERDLALDARGQAGVLDAQLTTSDSIELSWRAVTGPSGQLAGRRWSSQGDPAGCPTIHEARAITSDLRALSPALAAAAAWSEDEHRALAERLVLAELALELSARACERRGRATLPAVTGPFAWR